VIDSKIGSDELVCFFFSGNRKIVGRNRKTSIGVEKVEYLFLL
jgi:hypothetical protein